MHSSGASNACHLTSDHASDSTPPKILRQLIAGTDITRERKKVSALGIKKEATYAWREEHDIPGTESLLKAEEMQKDRSDTISTPFSDRYDPKRLRIYYIPE